MSEHSTVDIESEGEVRSGGIGARVLAGGIGLVLLVGGVGFAAAQMSDDGGSPEGAVQELFDAVSDEDVLGVLATLDPGERETLSGPVEDLFDELERLEVLDDSFELSGVQGVDLEFEDLTFRTEEIRDDLARVHLTGGTASYAVDTDELPIGAFVSSTLERFGVEYRGIQSSDSDPVAGSDDDLFLVVRDGDDGWRVSIGYTAAEAARLASDAPAPTAGGGLVPIGADSPEAAVEGFLRAATDLDVAGMVARLSPDELRALQDYWTVLAGGAGLPSAEDLGAQLSLTDLELSADTDGDHARVRIDSIGLDVDAEEFTGGATIADGCVTLRGDLTEALAETVLADHEGPLCQDDLEALGESMGRIGAMGAFSMGGPLIDPGSLGDTPPFALTATEVDGEWYLAPVRTVADLGLEGLRAVEREDIEAAIAAIETMFGDMSSMVGGGFVPPLLGGAEPHDGPEAEDRAEETDGPFGQAPASTPTTLSDR